MSQTLGTENELGVERLEAQANERHDCDALVENHPLSPELQMSRELNSTTQAGTAKHVHNEHVTMQFPRPDNGANYDAHNPDVLIEAWVDTRR